MYGNPQSLLIDEVHDLRRQGGQWLKEQRLRAGLSQRELAARVGVEYYTFVSQLEIGRGRLPPDRYLVWARALNLDPRNFVLEIMRFYDPVTYSILFSDSERSDAT